MNIVEFNKYLGLFLMDKEEELKEQIVKYVNLSYEIGYYNGSLAKQVELEREYFSKLTRDELRELLNEAGFEVEENGEGKIIFTDEEITEP